MTRTHRRLAQGPRSPLTTSPLGVLVPARRSPLSQLKDVVRPSYTLPRQTRLSHRSYLQTSRLPTPTPQPLIHSPFPRKARCSPPTDWPVVDHHCSSRKRPRMYLYPRRYSLAGGHYPHHPTTPAYNDSPSRHRARSPIEQKTRARMELDLRRMPILGDMGIQRLNCIVGRARSRILQKGMLRVEAWMSRLSRRITRRVLDWGKGSLGSVRRLSRSD